MIRVAIVEDHDDLRAGFAGWIEATDGLTCVGQYASAEEALAALPGANVDVVLMDINLPGLSGVECVRRLKAAAPRVLPVMLTVFDDGDSIFESLRAGAVGYVLKRAPRAEILDAVFQAHDGGAPMTGAIARKVVHFFNRQPPPSGEIDQLTDRERDVLHALSEGAAYKEIADRLSVSVNTVRKHIKAIYETLQVHSRHEAVRKLPPKP